MTDLARRMRPEQLIAIVQLRVTPVAIEVAICSLALLAGSQDVQGPHVLGAPTCAKILNSHKVQAGEFERRYLFVLLSRFIVPVSLVSANVGCNKKYL